MIRIDKHKTVCEPKLQWPVPALACQLRNGTKPYAAYTGQYDLQLLRIQKRRPPYDRMQYLWGETPAKLLSQSEEAFGQNYGDLCQ